MRSHLQRLELIRFYQYVVVFVKNFFGFLGLVLNLPGLFRKYCNDMRGRNSVPLPIPPVWLNLPYSTPRFRNPFESPGMIGKTLAHYEITGHLGKGGMGDVFRARDTKLDREVALKVLPPNAARDPERRRRFEKEAKAVAALQHPNIVTIYSVDEVDGVHFLTMELVDGRTLREHVAGDRLSVDSFFELAIPLTDAVSCAHAKGIIHRDLKPTNVMLDGKGRLKVLDFGLAKLLEPVPLTDDETVLVNEVTQAGTVMGTAAYMSPEQAEGKIIDLRSDVFSLGIILHELATGKAPFRGSSPMATIAAILTETPPMATQIRPDFPEDLGRIIYKCLEKDPQHRYRSASDLRDDLIQIQGAPPVNRQAPDKASIVVLPFANLSPDPDTEYFSDGLTDEIITDLSQVRALRVISRSSAMRLKGDERGLEAIGRDLACRYVLEGSVRRAANSLRITARLVDVPSDAQLWADKYGGTLDDVFDFQEQVSRAIVDALEIQLTPQEAAQLADRPIEDVRAQESYLRARSEIWSFLPGGLDLAISHLEAALRLVGDNVLLYQGLGETYCQYINVGAAIGREEEFIKKSECYADKIFELEPDSPRGHLVKGYIQLVRGNIHDSGESFRRVLQAFPKDILALQLYVHVLGWLGGKPEAAAPLVARLVDIDPLNPMSLLMNAMVPLFAGRFSEAVEPARRMFELDPVTPVWRSNFVMALSYAQQIDEAEALTEGLIAEPDSDIGTWWMGLCRATWRTDRAEVLRLADGPYQQVAAWDAEVPWALASAHAAVGAKDEALLWLDRAIERGMINYPFLAEHDRYLDNIRGDARFEEVIGRAKQQWERFEV